MAVAVILPFNGYGQRGLRGATLERSTRGGPYAWAHEPVQCEPPQHGGWGAPARRGVPPAPYSQQAIPWRQYDTTVDAIEASTGFNMFNQIRTDLQNELEVGGDNGPTG